ncbi:MAG TPA: GTPase ObgE [Fimbriimonadaceae bacterium]|jgi:GTP-binding protein
MFLDEALVEFHSGRGGAGSASFHREKHVPRGGPNGSDGGRGGDIVLVADRGRRTLYDFRIQHEFKSKPGSDAAGNKRGKDADDIEIRVPVGTIVFDVDLDAPIIDLNLDGMRYVVCKGGRGGFGNLHYTSSIRQAPTFAQKGAPGETVNARLELKLLADIGIIGLPNAGKSTLIGAISAAKPKIADYPFTTIVPNLGVVSYGDNSFTVADMPGLVEGASEGRGLGHQFLKHVERTRVLIHLVECVPMDESDPIANFELIEQELKSYSETICSRPRIVGLSKIDTAWPELVDDLKGKLEKFGYPVFAFSAVTGQGVEELTREMSRMLDELASVVPVPVLIPAMSAAPDLEWHVDQEGSAYEVKGKRVERLVAMTDMSNDEALHYLHRRLERLGIINKLRDMGVQEGDTVRIGDLEFAFADE